MPRSYYDIKGRPDEDAWYGAADKELTKLFDMGTFEITEASSVPKGTKIMDTVSRSRERKIAREGSRSYGVASMPTADNRKRGAAGIRSRLQANSAVSGLYARWQLKRDSHYINLI